MVPNTKSIEKKHIETAYVLNPVGEGLVCNGEQVWVRGGDRRIDAELVRSAAEAMAKGAERVELNDQGDEIRRDFGGGRIGLLFSIGENEVATNVAWEEDSDLIDLLDAAGV